MNDGSRDRLSPGARELFRAARVEALPSSADRDLSLDRLQALPSNSAVPPPTPLHRRTSGAGPRRIGGRMRLLLAAAALFVTAGSLAAVLRLRSERPGPDVSPGAPERAAPARQGPKAAPLAAPVVSSETANPVVPPIADVPPAESRPPTASSPSVTSRNEPKGDTRDDMNEELVLLGDARRALAAHQGATALRLLDEDRQRFPNSTFREERAYTRIRALCELGRSAEASADAERFLKKWPRSMYAAGVRRSCAFASEGTPAGDSVTGSRTPRH